MDRTEPSLSLVARAILPFLFAILPSATSAYDFHLALHDCQILMASSLDATHPTQTVPGDSAVLRCIRRSEFVVCDWLANQSSGGLSSSTEYF
jgi:hypothetical protein